MRSSRKWFETQTNVILDEHENEGGGRGWRLVDLNAPLPPLDEHWLLVQLVEREVMCEFPECDAQAIGLLAVKIHTCFICKYHSLVCTVGDRHLVGQAQADLAHAMLRRILDTTYGVTTGTMSIAEQLMQPLRLPTPEPRGPVQVTPLLPRPPRFGQI